MTWKKIYVVGDKKKKEMDNSPPPYTPPESNTVPPGKAGRWKRFRNSSIVAVVFFSSGLGLGVYEDDLDDRVLAAINGEEYQEGSFESNAIFETGDDFSGVQNLKVKNNFFFLDYEVDLTNHFKERESDRNISEAEVREVMEYGTVVNFWSNNRKNRRDENSAREPKFNMLGETAAGRNVLVSFTVPLDRKVVNLITVMAPWEE